MKKNMKTHGLLYLEEINLPSGKTKNIRKPRNKGRKGISKTMLYDQWANVYKLSKQMKLLKKDLERDCKAYWKYDDKCKRIDAMQKARVMKDELEEYKQ